MLKSQAMNNYDKMFYKNLQLRMGVEEYSKISNKTSQIANQANLLAKCIRSQLNLNFSQIFLETIYIPFLAHFIQFRELEPSCKLDNRIFRNFGEFHDFIFSHDYIPPSPVSDFDWEWQGGEYDFIAAQPINIYEKIVYSLFRISHLELKMIKGKECDDIKPDLELRLALKSILLKHCNVFNSSDIIDFLPLTLLEGINGRLKPPKYPFAAVHWLGQIHNENYLFYLAFLRDKGSVIIGQPHAGCMFRANFLFGNQIAEMMLSDVYHPPMWVSNLNAFPDLRASRNLFINFKHLTLKKSKKKMLVVMPGFYSGQRRALDKMFYAKNITSNEFLHKQLNDLRNHFSFALDFKPGLRQYDFEDQFMHLKKIYTDCEFVTDISVQEASHRYEGVIHLVTWATAIVEMAGTRIPQYVYLGPEISLNKEYESFLWNYRKSSTRRDYHKGTWLKIDNNKLKLACGASYFYPFHYARLIKRLIGISYQPKARSRNV